MIGFKKLGNVGRLGNQLFQISSTIGIAKKSNEDFIFPQWKYQQYYQIPSSWFDNEKLKFIDKNFHDYLQDYNNFYHIENDIISYFQPSKLAINLAQPLIDKYLIKKDNIEYLAVGVRRTDYLKYPQLYPIPSNNYYNNSINFIKQQRSNKVIKTICFSDDINWCKNNIDCDLFFDAETMDVVKCQIISNCDHFVIANSTFHWWAAYLSKNNTKKIVIYPIPWIGKNTPNKKSYNLYYSSWYGFDNHSQSPINYPNNIVVNIIDGIVKNI